MKIHVTFDFDEKCRRAIAARTGDDKPASWADCKNWIESTVSADLAAIISDFDGEMENRKGRD